MFVKAERVVYKKNPLQKVICQVRYPPILSIDARVPADFQEAVRKNYPYLREKSELAVDIQIPNEGVLQGEEIKQFITSADSKNYEFASEDDHWKINLTRTFLSLSTNRYERWDYFRERMEAVIDTLTNIYNPNGLTRIGLRYINILDRGKLGLEAMEWKELLQPFLIGIVSLPDVSSRIKDYQNTLLLALDDKKEEDMVQIVLRTVKSLVTGEQCISIDSDFFRKKKMAIKETMSVLNYFNERARSLFRWCIQETLHNALEPEKQ